MRFALVIEPPVAPTGPDRLAALRLGIARAGFNVVRLHAGKTLRRDLARAIDVTEKEDSALVYVAGDVSLDGGEVFLASEPPYALSEMVQVICAREHAQVLVVLDARAAGVEGDTLQAAEHLETIVRAMAPKERGLELLAAVESSPASTPPSMALTRFFVQALEDPGAISADGTMRMEAAYTAMKSHPEFSASVPSFVHVKGGSDFVVVAPIAERISEPPPSRASVPSSGGRSSAPPSSARRSRSILPLPAIEPILADAERAHVKGRWDEALEGYRKALMLLGVAEPAAMASLYASVAEVKLAQGKKREAEATFEKALAAVPDHLRSLAALVKMATESEEWARAASFERKRGRALGDPTRRVEAYARSAELYEQAKDLPKAVEVLEEAIGVKPGEPVLLQALRAGYEALRQWKKLVDVLGQLAEIEPLLHDKAQRRFEQADVLLGRLRDESVGLAVLASALEDDPTHERALTALVSVHSRREEWREIERAYAKLVEAFASREDAARAWEVCKKLGQLRRDKLSDGPGALEAFTAAVKLRPKDVESRAALAELFVAKGDRDAAARELEVAAHHDPTRAATHRRLFELHRRAGNTDRAWLAATALEALGATDVDQAVFADQFRGEGRPSSPLDDAAWLGVRAHGADPVIDDIVRAIGPAAVAVKVAALRAEHKLVHLDAAKRQPPDSTATLVRMFGMASEVLGVPLPDLYSHDVRDGALAAVQAPAPSTVFGDAVMAGRKLPELGFVVARHLVYYRPEHYALVFYPTLPELTSLVLAAVKLARPELPLPADPASAALRKELLAHATEAQRVALAVAVELLDARGGKLDLAAWLRSVELTANRVGMVFAGDLHPALHAMRGETRHVGEVTFEERRADLLAFTASRELADLRVSIGLAARASMTPPPPASAPELPPS